MTETAEPAVEAPRHRIDYTVPPAIRAEGVWKVFGPNGDKLVGSQDADLPRAEQREKTGCVVAVRDVSLEVWPGEVFVVMGLSGSGKSTLVQLQSAVFRCPYCGSTDTRLENIFGPTPCRSLRYCASCRQPFEQFKTI